MRTLQCRRAARPVLRRLRQTAAPSPLPARRVRLAARHLMDDDTQPVLRFTVRPRPARARRAPAVV